MQEKTKKRGVLRRLFFNRADERAYGRFAFFFDGLMQNFSNIFSGGVFYTAFLRLNNISMAEMGIMTYLPIIANLSCVFSPFLFAKFKKRKSVLMAARLAYYFFNLVGVALVPVLFSDAGVKLGLMTFFLCFGNAIWGLFCGGFDDWELKFLPQDGTREEYYAYRNLIFTLSGVATQILAGFVATAIEALPEASQMSMLFWLRVGSFLFIPIDILVFMRAKEYPYPKSELRLKLRDLVTVPIKNRAFRNVALIHAMTLFAGALTLSSWTYYLLDCGLAYSTQSFLAAIPPILTLLLTRPVVLLFRRQGCAKNLLFYRTVEACVYFGYAMISPANIRWLYPILYVVFQIIMVGISTADVNFIFLFMPEKDRLTYHAFNFVTGVVAEFIGAFLGAQFITRTAGKTFHILGQEVANVRLLMLLQAIFFFVVVAFFYSKRNILRTPTDLSAKGESA